MDKYATLTVKQLKEKLTSYKIKGISALKKEALLNKLFMVEFENSLNAIENISIHNANKESKEIFSDLLLKSPRKQRYISNDDKKDVGRILGSIELNTLTKKNNIDLSNFDDLDIIWFHNRLNYEGQNSYLLLKCGSCGQLLGPDKDMSVYIFISVSVKEDESYEGHNYELHNSDIHNGIIMKFNEDIITDLSLSNTIDKIIQSQDSEAVTLYMEETEPLEHIYQGSNIILENGVIVKINGRYITPRYLINGSDPNVESKVKSGIIYTMLNYLYIENYVSIPSVSSSSSSELISSELISSELIYDNLTKIDTIFWTHFNFNDSSKFNYILYKTLGSYTLLKFKYNASSNSDSLSKKFTKTSVYLSHKFEDIIIYGMTKHDYDLYEHETLSYT